MSFFKAKSLWDAILKLIVLVACSLLLLGVSYFYYVIIDTGTEAQLMTLENEPKEGWDYWYWHFIKKSFWEIFIPAVILVILGVMLIRAWVLHIISVIALD